MNWKWCFSICAIEHIAYCMVTIANAAGGGSTVSAG